MSAENVADAQWGIEKKGYEPLTLEAEEIPVLLTDVAVKSSDSAYAPGLFGFNDTGYQSYKAMVLNFTPSGNHTAAGTEKDESDEHVGRSTTMSNQQFYLGQNNDKNNVTQLKKTTQNNNKRNQKSVATRYTKRKKK